MKNKRIISLVLIMTLVFSIFPANVYADTIEDSLRSIMTSIGNIIKEVVSKFKDIKESDWFANDVSILYKLGIIKGKPQDDGTVIFDPKGLVTKAEFTKMLVEAMGYKLVDGNTFSDVGYDRHWAKKYIETAVKEGVIDTELEGENYWSDIPIKRFNMAMMMFKALKFEYSENPSPFPDVDCGCVTKLHEEYLINGSPEGNTNYFKPSGLTTRAEAAAIISRMVEYKENPKAYKEKKEAEIAKEKAKEEFYKNIDKGVSQSLLDRKITFNDKVWYNNIMEAHEDGRKYIGGSVWIKEVGAKDLEEFLDMCEEFAREWMAIDWNIDYTKMDEYRPKANEMMQEFRAYNYLERIINDYTKNTVVSESKFYTGKSLITGKPSFAIRGTLVFRFLEPTNPEYLKQYIDKDTNKPIKLNTWYEADVQLNLAPEKVGIQANRLNFLDYVGRQEVVKRVNK